MDASESCNFDRLFRVPAAKTTHSCVSLNLIIYALSRCRAIIAFIHLAADVCRSNCHLSLSFGPVATC